MCNENDVEKRIDDRRIERQKKRKKAKLIRVAIACALALILIVAPLVVHSVKSRVQSADSNNIGETSTESTTEKPTEPFIEKTATIGVTGDILIHHTIINHAKTSSGSYNFDDIFTLVKPYFNSYDYMIANLEVTLAGADRGYSGYPQFNSPDELVSSMKDSGIDMALTANNHSYDTGLSGMRRTLQILKSNNMDFIGTRSTNTDGIYKICDINGINVGMACYTYETTSSTAGRKSLNGLLLNEEATPLVNSFNYNNLSAFYSEAENSIKAMKTSGADAIVFFLHWGNEYQLSPNDYQKTIAQKLCDLGVDVIIGGHPHVIQPFDTLTSENGHETICLYSIGNAVSDQRREYMKPFDSGHTEDGVIFTFSFEKWNDGKTKISDVNIIPTWVNSKRVNGKKVYEITPIEASKNELTSSEKASFNRTMKLVGDPLNSYRTSHGLQAVQTSV